MACGRRACSRRPGVGELAACGRNAGKLEVRCRESLQHAAGGWESLRRAAGKLAACRRGVGEFAGCVREAGKTVARCREAGELAACGREAGDRAAGKQESLQLAAGRRGNSQRAAGELTACGREEGAPLCGFASSRAASWAASLASPTSKTAEGSLEVERKSVHFFYYNSSKESKNKM